MPPDEPTDEERLEELPEDNDTPFQPAAGPGADDTTGDSMTRVDRSGGLDSTHPQTDTNLQQEELYDEGLSGAAEAEEPYPGDAVVDFNPAGPQPVSDDDDDDDENDEQPAA